METEDLKAIHNALSSIQAIAEFSLDGSIISANDNFLNIFGYTLDEVTNKHHRIFCDSQLTQSDTYTEHWHKLAKGECITGEFRRINKDGQHVWLQASYNPILDKDGTPVRVIKFATDITNSKLREAEFKGKIDAINRSQAVIEFNLDGTVITANDNFLDIFGYQLEDVAGKHHRVLCDSHYSDSSEYQEFWKKLGRGEYVAGEFKRKSKDGREVWLQASYNPILDPNGQPYKVIKFALDITQEVRKRNLALLEMSTPVTKIWEGILFVPIIGIVDSKRSVDIMNKALTAISNMQARVLMLDISGVAIVDTAVANHLIKIAKAAVLMGCDTIISGISPLIAQTITELGIDMGTIKTTSTIAAALRESIEKID